MKTVYMGDELIADYFSPHEAANLFYKKRKQSRRDFRIIMNLNLGNIQTLVFIYLITVCWASNKGL